MFQLNFTSKVLGEHSAERLRRREKTQTIRSKDDGIVQAYTNKLISPGDKLHVVLDGEIIGEATIDIIDRLSDGCGFSSNDAEYGGFKNMKEFFDALCRAGYLFPELNRYNLYRVKFTWI